MAGGDWSKTSSLLLQWHRHRFDDFLRLSFASVAFHLAAVFFLGWPRAASKEMLMPIPFFVTVFASSFFRALAFNPKRARRISS
jgi:hypothetical protein